MQTLIVGDSISYGYGFPLALNDPHIWPNKLAQNLNLKLTNLSIPGYDNSGIFLNLISNIFRNNYDLVLVQLTTLNRIILSPNMHCRLSVTNHNGFELHEMMSKMHSFDFSVNDYKLFSKVFQQINGLMEHWNRLIKIIYTLQDLSKTGYNIKIINGGISWPENLFLLDDTNYAKEILNYHSLPDEDIKQGLYTIMEQVKNIDLSIWVNPFENLIEMSVDCAPLDNHPGIQSHTLYTNMLLDALS